VVFLNISVGHRKSHTIKLVSELYVRDEGTIGCVFIDRSTGRTERSVVTCQVWKRFVRRFELHWRACVMITSATSIQHHTRYFMKNVQLVSKL